MCSRCAAQHFLQPDLPHSPLPYESEDVQFPCSVCHGAEGVILCKCVTPWDCFCEDCFEDHGRTKERMHDTCPAAAKDFLENGRPIGEFFDRQQVLDSFQSLLRANLQRVELCRTEIHQMADDLIRLTENWRKDSEVALDSISTSIKALIEESLRKLHPYRSQWQIQVNTKLEQILHKVCFADYSLHALNNDLKLFSWNFQAEAAFSSLSTLLSTEVPASILNPVPNIYYVVPWKNELLCYSLPCVVPTRQKLLMKGKFKSFSAWCEAGPGKLLLTGGYKYTSAAEHFAKDVNLINLCLLVATPMPSLVIGRCRHSLLSVHDRFYVIGGFNCVGLKSIEMYDSNVGEWMEVAQLSEGKDCASAVVWRDKAYIIGFAARKIEYFDPMSNLVGVFSIKLNVLFDFFCGPRFVTLLGVEKEELIVLLEEGMLRVELRSGNAESSALGRQLDKTWFSQCPAVFAEGKCYFFNLDQEFWKLDINQSALEFVARVVI